LIACLQLTRTVRFGDTDAAGVMHFHQLLRWCHEAWEESLERSGVAAAEVFPGSGVTAVPSVALPIVHCSADFRRPLRCGDRLQVLLTPRRLDGGSFEVTYAFARDGEPVARGLLRHRAIEAPSRRPCALPAVLEGWLAAAVAPAAPGALEGE
jgi:1,4-dihydroxy-2-naphthoyl-CoA hydrolase